jgi:hypothetical protein
MIDAGRFIQPESVEVPFAGYLFLPAVEIPRLEVELPEGQVIGQVAAGRLDPHGDFTEDVPPARVEGKLQPEVARGEDPVCSGAVVIKPRGGIPVVRENVEHPADFGGRRRPLVRLPFLHERLLENLFGDFLGDTEEAQRANTLDGGALFLIDRKRYVDPRCSGVEPGLGPDDRIVEALLLIEINNDLLIGFEPFGVEVFGLGSEFFAQRPVEEF